MTSYRVCFYKHLVSPDGPPFKCLQGQIDVLDSEDEAQAAQSAAKTFETLYGLPDWRLHADAVEVVCLGTEAQAATRNTTLRGDARCVLSADRPNA